MIDLPTIQKKANLHFSLTLDLFGNEISTNAANAFNAGLKGRYQEDKLTDDHQLTSATYPVLRLRDGRDRQRGRAGAVGAEHAAARRLCGGRRGGVSRWNRVLEQAGIDFRITLPHVAFNRRIGEFARGACRHRGQLLSRGVGARTRIDAAVRPMTTCSSPA